MREIKFRAWDKANKFMHQDVQDGLNAVNEKGVPVIGLSFGRLCRDEGNVIMQYTGLTDKNGKEIYEGDIIKYLGHYDGFDCEGIGKVMFYNYRFEVDDINIRHLSIHVEVIGNIYENKELLIN